MNTLQVAIAISKILGLVPEQFNYPLTLGQLVATISEEYARLCPVNPNTSAHERFYYLAKGNIPQQFGDSCIMLGSEPYLLKNQYGHVKWVFSNEGLIIWQDCNDRSKICIGFIDNIIHYYLITRDNHKIFEISNDRSDTNHSNHVCYCPGQLTQFFSKETKILFYNLIAIDEQLIEYITSTRKPPWQTGYDDNLEFMDRIASAI